MQQDCHTHFHTSKYPPNNIYNKPQVNKKVIGMMKDENSGILLVAYVGLKSEIYTSKVKSSEEELIKLHQKLQLEDHEDNEIENIIQRRKKELRSILKQKFPAKIISISSKILFRRMIN